MINREITDAYPWLGDDDTEWWMIHTTNPDGRPYVYAMPACTFENLAVEYGFEPDDIDTLLDVAIHQFHIPEPSMRRNHADDPAAGKGLLRKGAPVHLGNADSTAQARTAHLERIAWVKEKLVRVTVPERGQRRTVASGLDRAAVDAVEVDPHERLAALKATYKPDKSRMADTRNALSMLLGRPV
ncbi:hypothetical protein [Nonomuraea sp. NPDC049784]|uniref:hypothetical protein n=1 Tax=Nonomuraea sp. NPDC049784 TaxID=3154361 RepID=UPI0033E1A39B